MMMLLKGKREVTACFDEMGSESTDVIGVAARA